MHIVEKCQELTYKCLSVVYLFKRNKKIITMPQLFRPVYVSSLADQVFYTEEKFQTMK